MAPNSIRKDESTGWSAAQDIRTQDGTAAPAGIDIMQRKRMEELLKESLAEKEVLVQCLHALTAHDGLTRLYKHRTFHTLLEHELVRAQRFERPASLLLLHIDHFQRVNDAHGHLAGNAVLKTLSELLIREARAIDRVCRYGGEEITVILPESDLEAAAHMAERMRTAVQAQPFGIETGASINITVSIGVASFPAHADNAQTLVAAADAAKRAAKQGGGNQVVCCQPTPGQPS